jgi:(1->4)-alpha-D-glucan 1-alpha-D-glucosylmutase
MKRIPCATYRLQFSRNFTFGQAFEILDYLRELGISDVYASPLFQAGPESTHGYDTCCFGKINPNLGSNEDFERFTMALKKRGMGLLLDVVPNHMSATLSNPWWFDVLEKGRESSYARYFDIDWRPNNPALHDKVLLPVLEDHYAKVLENGKLRLIFQDGKFFIGYHERNFPVNSASIAAFGAADPEKILTALNGIPGDTQSVEKLDALIQRQHYRLAYWKAAVEEINYRRFFDVTEMVALKMELPEVFRETHKLIFEWLEQGKITGLRIDHPDGLWNPKEYLERLQKQNVPYIVVEKILSSEPGSATVPAASSGGVSPPVQGEDSLKSVALIEPQNRVTTEASVSFSSQKEEKAGMRSLRAHGEISFDVQRSTFDVRCSPIHGEQANRIHVEEQLPADWPTDGTTGYDFLNRANGLFVDSTNASVFDDLYREFTGNDTDFDSLVYRSRKQVLERSFASEVNSLAHRLKDIAARTQSGRNFTFGELHQAIAEMAANFPVYRTYITESSVKNSTQDREVIQYAAKAARERAGLKDEPTALVFLEQLLLLELGAELDQSALNLAGEFIMKFQQLTGPAMAKGLEDTAFYRFNRLVSLNEVGGEPGRFGVSVAEFHAANEWMAKHWPHTMLASSTHDTKRGEDVRARLNVLSEMPGEWRETLSKWSQLNRDKKTLVKNTPAPDANDEYLLYQTLVGAWPVENSLKPIAQIELLNLHTAEDTVSLSSLKGGERRGEEAFRVQGEYRHPKTDTYRHHEPPQCSAAVPAASSGGVSPPVRENADDEENLKTFRTRIVTFILKAAKEAKLRTSWTDPNAAYEKALQDFVERALAVENQDFLKHLRRFAHRVAFFGRLNSLSQTLLKMTSPGVPDFYQGAELWDLNLVDPDNRKPVDFALRQKTLSELKEKFADVGDAAGNFFTTLLRDEPPGAIKLFLIWRVLNFRGSQRELFDQGDYLPLVAIGEKESHVCAFTRRWNERTIVIIVPRLVFGLCGGADVQPIGEIWKNTTLPLPHARAGDLFRNVLTREMVPAIEANNNAAIELRQAMKTFPVVLLEKI